MEAKGVHTLRKYHAILFKNGEPIEVHHMTLVPDIKDSAYTAIGSMNWFNEREAQTLVAAFDGKKPKSPFHTNIKCDQDFEFDRKFERRAYAPDPALTDTLPEFTHASIWDFYKAIGYDYKAKRYTRTD